MLIFWIKLVYSFIAGIFIGSFLNVCIVRIPKEESVVRPRSHCPKCKKLIPWFLNIPLFSFFYLRGKCNNCQEKISWRYPFIEFLTGLLFILVVFNTDEWIAWPFHAYLMCALIITVFVDLDHWIIPDVVTLPGIGVGLLGALLIPHQKILLHILGVVIGGGSFLLVAWIYEKMTKKEGIGGGDVKFLAMVGAFLGASGALTTFILSSILGSIFGIFLILIKGKSGKTAIPFGPYLAAATLLTFLFGDWLWKWYFHIT